MGITTAGFLGFICGTILVYYLVSNRWKWIVLLLASVIFYLSFSVTGIFVLIGTALLTWFCALKVQKGKDAEAAWMAENKKVVDKETRQKQKEWYKRQRRKYIALCVSVCVGSLFLFKYYGNVAKGINSWFGINLWTAEKILIPLGISYYSLQLIGYLIDVSRDIIPAEKNALKVILYGMFFLSIMQGPFNRYGDLMPQVCRNESKRITPVQFKNAMVRICAGYIKKLCIADQVGMIAREAMGNYSQYTGATILVGIVCYAIQLYADFSGYMDIVIGIGELFGICLPENFRQPFFSRSIQEFWQRWHITLGAWLKDYVFYPLLKTKTIRNLEQNLTKRIGKELGRKIPTFFAMLILWILIGTWHGAQMNYIFSVGLLQFIYIIGGELFQPIANRIKKLLHIGSNNIILRIIQSIRVTVLMMFAWVFFFSRGFSDAFGIVKQLFQGGFFQVDIMQMITNGFNMGALNRTVIYFLPAVLIIMLALDLLHERGIHIREALDRKFFLIRLCVYVGMLVVLLVFGAYGTQYIASNFIYFEF